MKYWVIFEYIYDGCEIRPYDTLVDAQAAIRIHNPTYATIIYGTEI